MPTTIQDSILSTYRLYLQGATLSLDILSGYLQLCLGLKDQISARALHSVLISTSLDTYSILGDTLIRMYSNSGDFHDACLAFCRVSEPTTYSWQAIISCYITHGEYDLALSLYQEMQCLGIEPNKFIFPCVLKACGCLAALEEGHFVHEHIMRSKLEGVLLVGNTLIDMYTKCQNLKDARAVFDSMHHKDVVSWGSIIQGYAQHGEGVAALHLFRQMQENGIEPNRVAFLCILKACAGTLAVAEGRLIHEQIISAQLETDVLVSNTLIDMYAKCGSLEDASKVLEGLKTKTVSSWNAIIGGYAHTGDMNPAFECFSKMQIEGIMPDTVSYACILTACGSKGALEHGRLLHELIVCTGFESNEFVGNTLVDMYSKCGSLGEARNIFDGLANQNSVSWGAILAGYAQHGYGFQALELFEKMIHENIRTDEIVLSCVLKACTSIEGFQIGKIIHSLVVTRGLEIDLVVGNTTIDFYAKFGSMKDAYSVFEKLTNPNVVSWGAVLSGYEEHGQGHEGFEFLKKMITKGVKPDNAAFSSVVKSCGKSGLLDNGRCVHEHLIRSGLPSDIAVGNALIEMYMRCDCLEDARKVFDMMPERDVVSWNLIFTVYAENDLDTVVLELLDDMKRGGTRPNQVTFLVILRVCGNLRFLMHVKQTHFQIVEDGLGSDLILSNSLIDTYSKCGSIEDSHKVFECMPVRDEVSWGAIIAGLAQNGNYDYSWQCIEAMQKQGLKPNSMIYTSILSACSHNGKVEEGRKCFKSMKDLRITPTVEHYNCMIDLLARAGFLKEAKQMLDTMPVSPDVTGWTSLLTSCRAYADFDIGNQCLDQIALMDEDVSGGCALMSNLCAETHRWEEVDKLIGLKQNSSWKKPGAAWIEIDDKVQRFVVADKSHPQNESIDNLLKRHRKDMCMTGYFPFLNSILEQQSKENTFSSSPNNNVLSPGKSDKDLMDKG